jgi:hypothetical protein
MKASSASRKKILLIYFSFSSQTNNLVLALISGLEKYNITVVRQRLVPLEQIRFPIGSIRGTIRMMVATFFRKRFPIEPIDPQCFHDYDLIILAGPTWSYNPSGPVLSLFDQYGGRLFTGRLVLPLISCRGYWRFHWWGLKNLLGKYGARIVNVIVFSHPNPEPWRTIGVFLKLAGEVPEKKPWLAGKYRKYGHTQQQLKEAKRFGKLIGRELDQGGNNLHHLNFDTEIAQP